MTLDPVSGPDPCRDVRPETPGTSTTTSHGDH